MKCQRCGAECHPNAAFCAVCGNGLQPTGAPAATVRVVERGVCLHCGKSFTPKGAAGYRGWCTLSAVMWVLFAISALLTLLVLMGGSGIIWVFTLIFGVCLFLIGRKKKTLRMKMDEEPCPFCGKNKSGVLVAAPAVMPKAAVETAVPTVAPEVPFSGEGKTCARCGRRNAKENKTCDKCGLKFGKCVTVTDGKNKFARMTCPGCGAVYTVQKNVLLIVICAVLGVLLLGVWLPGMLFFINTVPAVLLLGVAILHATGHLHCFSVKRCSCCKRSPLQILMERRRRVSEEKLNRALLARKRTALDDKISPIAARLGNKHLLPLGLLIAAFLFIVMLFIPATLTRTVGENISRSQDLAYLDAFLNFGGPMHIIPLVLFPIFFIATLVSSFFDRATVRGIPLTLGVITSVIEFTVAFSSLSFYDFEHKAAAGRLGTVVYEVQYDPGLACAGVIVSAILILASVAFMFVIEREKRYLDLILKNTEV